MAHRQNKDAPITTSERLHQPTRDPIKDQPVFCIVSRKDTMTTATLKDITEEAQIKTPDELPDYHFPPLPGYARLSDKLLNQSEKAGEWLKAYTEFASKASPMTAPEYHRILGLILTATATARRVCLRISTDTIYPNLYALIVGASGDSKSGGTRLARKTGRLAGLSPLELPAYMSPQGLLQELIGRKPDNISLLDGENLESLKMKLRFSAQRVLLLDESESLFEWFGQDKMQGIKSLIRRLYDNPDEEGETTAMRGAGTARNCYLNICGISTPADLEPFFKKSSYWANGIWARFIFVTPSWKKPPYIFYPPALDIPCDLPDLLKHLFSKRLPLPEENKPAQAITASLADGVSDLWQNYDMATRYEIVNSENLSNRYKSNYKRLPAMLMKTALLLSIMDWTYSKKSAPIVEKSHFALAYLFTEQWRESIHRLLEVPNKDGQDDSLETKALRSIPLFVSGSVITERELAIKLNLSDGDERPKVTRLIEQMQKDGLIVNRTVNQTGKDGKSYKKTGFSQVQA
jgi:hypothetical protein